MKIGILTVPFNNNYGGLLQAFALKKMLVNLGHEVVFINRKRNRPTTLKYHLYSTLVRFGVIRDYLSDKTKTISINTDKFIENYLQPISGPYYSSKELEKCKSLGLDFYIVGSDQVWRYQYAKESILDFYFGFLKGTQARCISYAASFGKDYYDYPDKFTNEIIECLNSFVGISVRETCGKKILVEHLGQNSKNVHVVLDPTFLLPLEGYTSLFDKSPHKSNYMATYVLDDDSLPKEDLLLCRKMLNKDVINLKAQTGQLTSLSVLMPVEEWLSVIYYSDFVITDSFHGAVFSIIFNRPFCVYVNPRRGVSRLKDLLTMFGLGNRLKTKGERITEADVNGRIDWCIINESIRKLKSESLLFIKESLNYSK